MITLVPKHQIVDAKQDMFRIHCPDSFDIKAGWGYTLEEAIRDFDKNNQD